MTDDTKRCEICDWPLVARMEDGCVPGNCSYRPEQGTDEHRRIQERREALARGENPWAVPDALLELQRVEAEVREHVKMLAELVLDVESGDEEAADVESFWLDLFDSYARARIEAARAHGALKSP